MNGTRRRPSMAAATGPARSLGSGGSDGTRTADPVAMILLLLAALPVLASAPADARLRVERCAGDVREAAATLATTAGAVVDAGRLVRLERLEGDARALGERIRDLAEAVDRLQASTPPA